MISGRALLLTAFAKLMRLEGVGAHELITIAAKTAETDPKLQGALAWWRVLQSTSGFEDHHLRVSALLSYLPPEGFPVALLEELGEAPTGTAQWLAQRGLFEIHPLHGAATMHRLFGRAVRTELKRQTDAPQPLETWAGLRIATSRESLAELERHGDREGTVRLLGSSSVQTTTRRSRATPWRSASAGSGVLSRSVAAPPTPSVPTIGQSAISAAQAMIGGSTPTASMRARGSRIETTPVTSGACVKDLSKHARRVS